LDESQRRYRAAVTKYGGVVGPIAVVPAYEGPPLLAFVALTLPLARQRLLCWTEEEFIVFKTMGGEVPTTALRRVSRPAILRVREAQGGGHDQWTIAGTTYKVAKAFVPIASRVNDGL
jgi:hypothetical protein